MSETYEGRFDVSAEEWPIVWSLAIHVHGYASRKQEALLQAAADYVHAREQLRTGLFTITTPPSAMQSFCTRVHVEPEEIEQAAAGAPCDFDGYTGVYRVRLTLKREPPPEQPLPPPIPFLVKPD